MDALGMWKPRMDQTRPPPKEAVDAAHRALDVALGGDWHRAEAMLLDALGPLEEAEAPEAAPANCNLAVLLHRRGDPDGAVFHCVRGLFLYNKTRDLGGIYLSLRNLSLIHTGRGENSYAMAAQHQAARARRELVTRGLLDRVEAGRDASGNALEMLGKDELRPRLRAVAG
jgi:hypothetical protein